MPVMFSRLKKNAKFKIIGIPNQNTFVKITDNEAVDEKGKAHPIHPNTQVIDISNSTNSQMTMVDPFSLFAHIPGVVVLTPEDMKGQFPGLVGMNHHCNNCGKCGKHTPVNLDEAFLIEMFSQYTTGYDINNNDGVLRLPGLDNYVPKGTVEVITPIDI